MSAETLAPSQHNNEVETPLADTETPAEANPANNTESDAVESSSDKLESALETKGKEVLAQSEDKFSAATEKQAGLRIRAANNVSRVKKTALLLNVRERRYVSKVARLEEKLKDAKPGSRKAAKLGLKINDANYNRKQIEGRQDKILGEMHYRSHGFREEERKIDNVEGARNDKLIAKKIALERKRRRKVQHDYERSLEGGKKPDPRRAERLHAEIATWQPSNEIAKDNTMNGFHHRLEQSIDEKTKKRREENKKI